MRHNFTAAMDRMEAVFSELLRQRDEARAEAAGLRRRLGLRVVRETVRPLSAPAPVDAPLSEGA